MTILSNGNRWTLATLAATLMVSSVAFAQQATTSDPYSGVSQPPPDSTIVANPDAQPAPPPAAKPSPYVPEVAPATPAPAATASAPPMNSAVAPAGNPDFDIVSSVPAQSAAPAANGDATLQTRPNSDDGIVGAVLSTTNDLAEGTNIRVRLTEKLSTRET